MVANDELKGKIIHFTGFYTNSISGQKNIKTCYSKLNFSRLKSQLYIEITMMNIHAVQSQTSWATSLPPSPFHLLGLLATELYPGQLENLD